MSERPTGINASKSKREFTVTWADGHVSVYPFGLLRAACPCASCRGGHENMGSEPDPAVFGMSLPDSPATQLENIKAVGSYALTIVWADGHDYGIYNWHYLRMLCPCDVCRVGRSGS
jgi:prepilin-type processing-associated H-X9-DG protein